jgi:hypothetical protein
MDTRFLFGFLAMLFAAQIYASEITVIDAWARETAPGQENGSVGLVITSQKAARLISAETTAAASSEIHTMTMDNGVMKMRQLENLPLPAKQAVTLGPGSDHLMLFGLKQPLKAGDKVPLTLTVEFANKRIEKIKINALVKPLTGKPEHQHH